ncbi:MAG: polyhydroxyalkanoic acid synthase [Planctomycetes bacterium]|nr:polyhydroxyalkanoic acid synthase [Planctomycetota bacterium]
MPGFQVEVPHQLGRDEARRRLCDFLDRAKEIYKNQVSELTGAWSGDSLDFVMSTYGFKITGRLDVDESSVRLAGQLPFAAIAFRGKIESSFAAELKRALA